MTLCGMATLHFYSNCDPLQIENQTIFKAEQVLPYFIRNEIPWLSPLFLCAIVSATLSTLSSCLNSSATVIFLEMKSRKTGMKISKSNQTIQIILLTAINISVTGLAIILPM